MKFQTRLLILALSLLLLIFSGLVLFQRAQVHTLLAPLNQRTERDQALLSLLMEKESRRVSEWLAGRAVCQGEAGQPCLLLENRETLTQALQTVPADALWVLSDDWGIVSSIGSAGDNLPARRDALAAAARLNHSLHGYILAGEDETVQEIWLSPVRAANASDVGQGYLLLARDLEEGLLEGWGQQLKLDIDVRLGERLEAPAAAELRYALLGLDGKPVGWLATNLDDSLQSRVDNAQQYFLVGYLLAAALFMAALMTAMIQWLARPVQLLTRATETGDASLLATLGKSRSEFGRLARALQSSIEHRAEMDQEIRHRRQVEDELRKSEARYRTTSELTSDYAYAFSYLEGGRAVRDWGTGAFETITGYDYDEVRRTGTMKTLLHPDDYQMFEARNRQLMQGNPLVQEYRVINRSGEIRWMRDYTRPVWNEEHSQVIGLIGAAQDVTAFHLAEQEIRKERDLNRTVVQSVSALVITLDVEGHILQFNRAAEQMLGFSEHEVLGEPFERMAVTIEDQTLIGQARDQLKDFQAPLAGESWVTARDGVKHWLSWTATPIFQESRRPVYVVLTAVDMTERRRRDHQQETILAITSALRGTPTRQQALERTLKTLHEFLAVNLAAVALQEPISRQMVVECALGTDAQFLHGARFEENTGISGWVMAHNQPYYSNNLQAEKQFLGPDTLLNFNAGAWVPLVVEGRAIGVLAVGSAQLLREDDVRLLQAAADILAGDLHRAQLYDETQRRLNRFLALRAINIAIGASLDLRVTLNVLINQMTSQLQVSAVTILMLDPFSRMLEYAAGAGFHERIVEQSFLRLGEGLAGQVALERRPIYLTSITDEDGLPEWRAMVRKEGFCAFYAVPLIVKGQVKGVLEAYHRPPFQSDEEWPSFLDALATEAAIAIDNAELFDHLQRSNFELSLAYDATIQGWASGLEIRLGDTRGHSAMLADWTVRLAQEMAVPDDDLSNIRRGALLHDVGMMVTPDSVLMKEGPLDEDEWEKVRQHPICARELLHDIPFLRPAIDIPYGHHERWDGSGYPRKLRGAAIPLAARIFAVVDVWFALTADRPWRAAWPAGRARDYLRAEAGRLFDPQAVLAFLNLLETMSA